MKNSSPNSIQKEIGRRTLEVSLKLALLLFFTSAILFFIFQFRQQQYAIHKKLEVDKEFVLNALKIGDLFFVTRYVSAYVDSDMVVAAAIEQVGQPGWLSASPSPDEVTLQARDNFNLSLTGLLIKESFNISAGEYNWNLIYIYRVSYKFLVGAFFFAFFFSILIFVVVKSLLERNGTYFSQPISAISNDLKQSDVVGSGELNLDEYSEGMKFQETEDFVKTLQDLLKRVVEQQEELKEVEILKALNKLSLQVNHDIKSPIGAIKAAIGTMEDQSSKQVALMKRAVDRIDAIVDDLKLKNPEVKNQSDSLQKIDLLQFLGSLVEEKTIEHSKSKAVIDFSSNLEKAEVRVHPTDFSRALSNIINNGIEAIKEGTPLIKVNLKQEADNYVISISDNGPGIPKELRSKIFTHGFTHGKPTGSGTGLAQAKKVLDQIGGGIELCENENLEFQVRLKIFK